MLYVIVAIVVIYRWVVAVSWRVVSFVLFSTVRSLLCHVRLGYVMQCYDRFVGVRLFVRSLIVLFAAPCVALPFDVCVHVLGWFCDAMFHAVNCCVILHDGLSMCLIVLHDDAFSIVRICYAVRFAALE